MLKYLMIFFVSMVPLVELRLAMPMAVGMDLPYFPALAVCVVVFYFTGALLAFLAAAAYYVFLGYALSRFVFASFTNAVFDNYINSHMEGVQVNRGLAVDDDDEDEEEEETLSE